MQYFSMSNGIGGLEIPLLELNHECVGDSEIDLYAVRVYQKHFPTYTNYGDATALIPEELPDFDLLCGEFPCQAFRVAFRHSCEKLSVWQDKRTFYFHKPSK